MRLSLYAAALVATAATSFAQTPIGPFTGQYSEGFETYGLVLFTPCMPSGVFGGTANLCTPTSSGCHTTGGWSFQCQIGTHGGTWLFGSAGNHVEFTFPTPAFQFGGYFGSHSGFPDATVNFFDSNNNLLGTQTAGIPADCQYYWNGWSTTVGFSRIEVIGLNPYGGGFVIMDDLEVDYTGGAPTPVVYCSAGTTTNGCVASISASGNPNVAHNNTCQIAISGVEGQKSGILFYGLSSGGSPWCSIGGTSFLCVKAPTQRTGTQNSNGTTGLCDGALSLDWNLFQTSNPGSLGQPFSAGSKAFVQGWFRDPPACKTTNLSDAVELTYLP